MSKERKYFCPACQIKHWKGKPCKFTFFYEGRVCSLDGNGAIVFNPMTVSKIKKEGND